MSGSQATEAGFSLAAVVLGLLFVVVDVTFTVAGTHLHIGPLLLTIGFVVHRSRWTAGTVKSSSA